MGANVELAAAKIAKVNELLKQYPEEVEMPDEVKSEVNQLFSEYEEARVKAEEELAMDELRSKAASDYDFYHKGIGSPDKAQSTKVTQKGVWQSAGEWINAVYLASQGKVDPRLVPVSQTLIPEGYEQLKALTGVAGASAGYAIPVEFRPEILYAPGEGSIVEPSV